MTHHPLPPLILTLKLDIASQSYFNELRQRHFPPERNYLEAHVTLFHALPSEQETEIRQFLKSLCAETSTLPLSFPKVRFLGRGVAVDVESLPLMVVQRRCGEEWQPHLTPQDQQPFRPHITIQNKVSSESARLLYDQLSQNWQSRTGEGEGLLLWYYRGGPWELVEAFLFA